MDKKYQAIFFDMDGTLIQTKSGAKFPKHLWDWIPNPGMIEKVREFYERCQPEYLLIVSNQSQLAKRPMEAWQDFKHKKMEKVAQKLFPIESKWDVAFAPKKDYMRKPNPGMGNAFAEQYSLDLSNCLMVGDASDAEKNFSDSDRKFAEACGMDYLDIKEFLNFKFSQND